MKKEFTSEEYKNILLEILIEFHKFCEENKLTYYLDGGTLIGAIRHQGFIPWDDDIDVTMPRKDYDRFINLYKSNTGRYQLVSIENNEDYYLSFAKVIDTKTYLKEHVDGAIEIGAYLDVFPLDGFPNKEEALNVNSEVKRYRDILNIKNIKLNSNRSIIKNFILLIGKLFFSVYSRKYLINKIITISSKYSNLDNNKYVAPMVSMVYGERSILEKELFSSTTVVTFEGQKVNAPIGYNKILTKIYGDYMKLPPEKDRITHHAFSAWMK